MSNDDDRFDERTRTLLRLEPSLEPGDTISRQTLLARGGDAAAHDAAPTTLREQDLLELMNVDELPRISIAPMGSLAKQPADYLTLSTLGEGGMGRVHLAHQRSLVRDVAVKTLLGDAPDAVARALLREARLTGSLEHPGVIPVYALGVDQEQRPILVMKRVDGRDLGELLANREDAAWSSRGARSDTLSSALEILAQVCLTIEYAHSRGVIHCDIKPQNVMVGGFGEVYLLDWGIAVTRDGPSGGSAASSLLVGTPAYMPPEMVLGTEMDERTDVYLLGATLHEILTGKPRHVGPSVRAVLEAAAASAPFTYGAYVPEALASLCNRATARDRASRPASAHAFREELLRFQRQRSTQALCDVALERLALLEELLASAPAAKPDDLPTAYRLATEARFGLTQSLREGAGESAGAGMQRCLAALVELELGQGHADSAEALLREMADPPPPLAQRVADIRERDAARERKHAKLETLERDLDATALGSKRTVWILGSAIAVAAIWLAVAIRGSAPTPKWLVVVSLGGNVVAHVIRALLRRSKANAFTRGMGAIVALALGGSLLNRVCAYVFGAPSAAETLATDLLVFAVAAVAAAFAYFRSMWLIAVLFGGGMIAIRTWPEQGTRIFAGVILLSLLAGAALLARARKVNA